MTPVTEVLAFGEVEPGTMCGTLGYVTATWSTLPGRHVVLTFRSKPYSPTGLERGVPNGTLTGDPADPIQVGDYR